MLHRKNLPLTHNMPLTRTSLVIIGDSSSRSCTLRVVRPPPMDKSSVQGCGKRSTAGKRCTAWPGGLSLGTSQQTGPRVRLQCY